jgi:outer membrane protein assembly factor BamA
VTRDRFGGSFYAGIGTWRYAQMRLGVVGGYDAYSKPIASDGVVAQSHSFANPELRWIINTLDSGGLPSKGTRVEGAAGYSFRDVSFPYLNTDAAKFVPISRHFTALGTGRLATSFGEPLNFYEQFTAGGAGQLSAFRYQEFHAKTVMTSGAGLIFHAPPLRRLSLFPGVVVLYEAGRFDLGAAGWQTHQSVTTGILFPTPLGAAGLGVSFNERGKARFRLSLGALGQR